MAAEPGCGILLMSYICGGFICISREADGCAPAARYFCRSAITGTASRDEKDIYSFNNHRQPTPAHQACHSMEQYASLVGEAETLQVE